MIYAVFSQLMKTGLTGYSNHGKTIVLLLAFHSVTARQHSLTDDVKVIADLGKQMMWAERETYVLAWVAT